MEMSKNEFVIMFFCGMIAAYVMSIVIINGVSWLISKIIGKDKPKEISCKR